MYQSLLDIYAPEPRRMVIHQLQAIYFQAGRASNFCHHFLVLKMYPKNAQKSCNTNCQKEARQFFWYDAQYGGKKMRYRDTKIRTTEFGVKKVM